MTNNLPSQPFEPFHVQSDLLKSSPPARTGQPPDNSGWRWAEQAKWLAVPVFAVIYAVAQHRPEFQPVTIFVLLACVLFRMENRHRQLVGVVLTMAAIKLAYQMASHSLSLFGLAASLQFRDAFAAVPWLPMFFATCVFYMPRVGMVTGRIITIGAIAMLASGLLPGDGYVLIFGSIEYLLFFAVGIGMAVDYSAPRNGNSARGAARAA